MEPGIGGRNVTRDARGLNREKHLSVPSEIIEFYLGARVHPEGYTIDQMWHWDDLKVNDDHSFTQWLFPTNKASQSRSNSPIMSRNDVAHFNANPELRARLLRSFHMMLRFFGFTISTVESRLVVSRAQDFEAKLRKPFDKGMTWFRVHHFKRITRILESLCLLGLKPAAAAFYEALRQVYEENKDQIPHSTLLFWKDAAGK